MESWERWGSSIPAWEIGDPSFGTCQRQIQKQSVFLLFRPDQRTINIKRIVNLKYLAYRIGCLPYLLYLQMTHIVNYIWESVQHLLFYKNSIFGRNLLFYIGNIIQNDTSPFFHKFIYISNVLKVQLVLFEFRKKKKKNRKHLAYIYKQQCL